MQCNLIVQVDMSTDYFNGEEGSAWTFPYQRWSFVHEYIAIFELTYEVTELNYDNYFSWFKALVMVQRSCANATCVHF